MMTQTYNNFPRLSSAETTGETLLPLCVSLVYSLQITPFRLDRPRITANPLLSLATYYDRCVDRAQRRYLSAVQSLALARRIRVSGQRSSDAPNLRVIEGGQKPETVAAA
jgi:hypothetical protein